MLTWDGYVDPRVLDGFTDQYGTGVDYEIHTSDPDSVNKLRAGQTAIWDIINLNNPWARELMWPQGLIVALDRARFEPYFEAMLPMFQPPYKWAMSLDNEHLLGVCQRVDTFDFVVNTDVISAETAKDEGWDLFNNPDMAGRYGILAYDNWNVMHFCMAAGVHPFKEKTDEQVAAFEETARRLINGAVMISGDFVPLNLAVVNGEIDAYISGGTYSISSARLDGLSNLYHVVPKSGPADGKGGINWIELNSVVNNPTSTRRPWTGWSSSSSPKPPTRWRPPAASSSRWGRCRSRRCWPSSRPRSSTPSSGTSSTTASSTVSSTTWCRTTTGSTTSTRRRSAKRRKLGSLWRGRAAGAAPPPRRPCARPPPAR